MNTARKGKDGNSHIWRIISGILATAAALATVFTVAYMLGKADTGLVEEAPGVRKDYYGTYRDLKSLGKTYTAQERLTLGFSPHPTIKSVETIKGDVQGKGLDEQERLVTRTWEVSGYRSGDYLVMAYFTASEQSGGIGIYFLKKVGYSYVGYWTGKDAITGEVITGGYVLTKSELSKEDAERRFRVLQKPFQFVNVTAGGNISPNKPNEPMQPAR